MPFHSTVCYLFIYSFAIPSAMRCGASVYRPAPAHCGRTECWAKCVSLANLHAQIHKDTLRWQRCQWKLDSYGSTLCVSIWKSQWYHMSIMASQIIEKSDCLFNSWLKLTSSALLAFCEGNQLVNGGLHSQRVILMESVSIWHVFYRRDGDAAAYEVVAGVHNRGIFEIAIQRRTIDSIIIHPDFYYPTLDNDIALMHMAQPLRWTDYVRPICIATEMANVSTECVISGWGRTEARK